MVHCAARLDTHQRKRSHRHNCLIANKNSSTIWACEPLKLIANADCFKSNDSLDEFQEQFRVRKKSHRDNWQIGHIYFPRSSNDIYCRYLQFKSNECIERMYIRAFVNPIKIGVRVQSSRDIF